MKISIAYAPENRSKIARQLQTVTDTLKKHKHQVNKELAVKSPVSKSDTLKYYQKIKSMIKGTDALIIELTTPSTELGFIIADALTHRKPVLALISKATKNEVDSFFGNSSARFLLTKKYTDASLVSDIEEFLSFAGAKVDTKFILIITPEIDSYLRWKAKEEGVRKAEVVRKAIDELISRDKNYKA